ncbi:MAG TPA: dihydrofolate reductase [Nocardioidaceae bacterium]|nr:dihydrofolate reductase [Nocardioidaceae bacterium]
MTAQTGEASTPRRRIVLVAAVADNGVIGQAGEIPWRIPEDMKHFREVTTGHPVLMGRVTYESIGRPLPGRTNIVITSDPAWAADGVRVAGSVREGLDLAREVGGDVMVIGGARVYEATMGVADVQVLTEVHQSPEGDTFYPAFDRSEWVETRREAHDGHDFVWLERRRGV